MAPPPPGLFSTPAVWLRLSCNPLAISRATTSLEPPGVNGTMMRMVLRGKPCAWAGNAPLGETGAATAMMHAAHSRVMLALPRRTIARRYAKYGHSANEARPVHQARRTSHRLLASSTCAGRCRRQLSAFRRDGAARRARPVRHAVLGG